MLWYVSSGAAGFDLNFVLSKKECEGFIAGKDIDGVLIHQLSSTIERICFILDREENNFSFNKNNEIGKIGVPISDINWLNQGNDISGRIVKREWEKIKIQMIWSEDIDSLILDAWRLLARDEEKTLSEEQGLVERLFPWITKEERGIITDIFDF